MPRDLILGAPWDVPLAELDGHLRAVGVEPAMPQDDGALTVRDLDVLARAALATALRESVRQARQGAPPVQSWLAASESLVLNDDGSQTARERADTFWQSLTRIVHGCLALIKLGDLAEFPFFIELLRYQPAGHLAELAADVICRYVDPHHELDAPRLVQRAEEWWSDSGPAREGGGV